MRSSLFLGAVFFILASLAPAFGQKASSTPKPKTTAQKNQPSKATVKPKTTTSSKAAPAPSDSAEFEKARGITDLVKRIAALQKFSKTFPRSKLLGRAAELISSSYAQLGDEQLRSGETTKGLEYFRAAVSSAPVPFSDDLFNRVISQIPTNLFSLGQAAAASEIARQIEDKIQTNPKQLLSLSAYYLGTEQSADANRVATKAIELDPMLPAGFQALGMANRLSLELDESVAAYSKALELDAASIVSKRSLAEMKRATGNAADAVGLYREILAKDPTDGSAQTGLVLSLFDSGNVAEAEAELAKSLEANPNNLFLLVGAAYWYAANGNSSKTIEYAQRAIQMEPRYTWAHIAMSRGLILERRPLDAEKSIIFAKQYGNFPTLDYELATIRLQAGFFDEAADTLKKSFSISDGKIETKLAGRIVTRSDSFIELLKPERTASIFQTKAADTPENDAKLKQLLGFSTLLELKNTDDAALIKALDEFVSGNDSMRTHRQIYAASKLLEANRSLPKVRELTQAAVAGVDASLRVPSPEAAVLADELREGRRLAIASGKIVNIPEIPQATLQKIIRGRIEEIAGWSLFNEDKPTEAITRLRRAVSVLPEKSAWWRSSLWRLGAAYEANKQDKEALDSYIKSYTAGEPSYLRYSKIENLFIKVNGSSEGLDLKVGPKPLMPQPSSEAIAQNAVKPVPTGTPSPEPVASPTPSVEATPETIATPTPTVVPSPEIVSSPTPVVVPSPETTPEPTPEQTPTPTPSPEAVASPTPEATPQNTPEPTPVPTVVPVAEVRPTPTPEATPEATPAKPETTPAPEAIATPSPESTPIETTQPLAVPTATPAVGAENSTKPVFEPIVITVGSPKPTPTASDAKAGELSGETRARVVGEKTSSSTDNEPAPCLVASQDSVSLLANGGNLGILLGYAEEGDLTKIVVKNMDTENIQITLEPDIGRQSNRLFFIFRSVSEKKGEYLVTFEAPCGKKDIPVRVR